MRTFHDGDTTGETKIKSLAMSYRQNPIRSLLRVAIDCHHRLACGYNTTAGEGVLLGTAGRLASIGRAGLRLPRDIRRGRCQRAWLSNATAGTTPKIRVMRSLLWMDESRVGGPVRRVPVRLERVRIRRVPM